MIVILLCLFLQVGLQCAIELFPDSTLLNILSKLIGASIALKCDSQYSPQLIVTTYNNINRAT